MGEFNKDELRAKLIEAQKPYLVKYAKRLKKIEPKWNETQLSVPDVSTIEPYVQICDGNPELLELLFYGRMVTSSFAFSGAVGRRVHYLVRDKKTDYIVGMVVLMSDLTIPIRDKHIGWTTDQRWKRMNYLMNVHLCVSTLDLAKYLTGKLCALSVESREVQDYFEHKYGHKLAAMTCTSLFGKSSIYNRLQGYEYLGLTKGHSSALVPLEIKDKMREDFKKEKGKHAEIYYNEDGTVKNAYGVVKGFQKLQKYWDVQQTENQRGVYLIPLAHNYKEFLKGEMDELQPYDHQTFEELTRHWKERWLTGRIERINAGLV
ncbi:MAG: Druantia anti-phage system protein DruA [Bacilli bacterium]